MRPVHSRNLLLISIAYSTLIGLACGQGINEPQNNPGWTPKDAAGKTLNLNFETGDLSDWTATGDAWAGQPDADGIDPQRPLAGNKKSLHTGKYWTGGFEIAGDAPRGRLRSATFPVTAPWCSFLIGGGRSQSTRVEIVLPKTGQVIATASGSDAEELHPVVRNLEQYKGQKIFIRLIDEASGGWGHVNFDDFRFYDEKPKFANPQVDLGQLPITQAYPYQDLKGDEAASLMQVPAGFKVQCAAQEPDVCQPVAMAIDDRGRIWIAESYTYPVRDPEGAGRDRILIFEDTDQDGILDQRKVFIEGLNLVSGMALGFGGVYVGAAPYLMFIPDRNGDDIPDGQAEGAAHTAQKAVKFPQDVSPGAEVLLDGWGWEDTHEMLNTFRWGPDGWLYGCHGVFTHSRVGEPGTPDDERIGLNGGIWRFHPVTRKFEIFIEGTSNPWGIDFNQYGDAFITACVIPHLYYLVPHGRYFRQAGQHFNPHTYADIPTIARHRHFSGGQWNVADRASSDSLGGGHAHAGAMIYQGGSWPAEFTGKLFMHNIHGNRVNVDQLIPEGSGYAGDRDADFLLTGDKWSQMIDLQYGPDGQVWMIDWYDQEQCHLKDPARIDRRNGRIYRVAYNGAKNVAVDLQQLDNSALVNYALGAENEWYARHARRILQERAAAGKASLQDVVGIINTHDAPQVLRLMWLQNVLNGFSSGINTQIEKYLSHESPYVRAWAVRLLVQNLEHAQTASGLLQRFARLAKEDPSPVVRLQLASACCELPLADRWSLLELLVAHAEDATDHNIPLLLWYAMEPLAEENPQRALALGMAAGNSIPQVREWMIRRLGSGNQAEILDLFLQGLAQSTTDSARLTFLKGLRGALAGVRNPAPPAAWPVIYQSLSASGQQSREFDVYLYTLGLGAQFGDVQAAERLSQIISDEAGPQAERRVAFRFLVEDRNPLLEDLIPRLLQGTSLRLEAMQAVATQDRPEFAQAIIAAYRLLNPVEQRQARNTLASRVNYAIPFLDAIERRAIPPADLSADLVRQLQNLENPEIRDRLEKVWGTVRESNEDAQAQIAAMTALVGDAKLAPADAELGRAIFMKTCQQCHTLFGAGGKVGPDITGSNRANVNYLLSNIIDPSAVMAKEYQPTVIAMEDGRVVTGILKEETPQSLVLQTPVELVTLSVNEIEERKVSDQSMMPSGLLKNLSKHEIRSLVAYLGSPTQVPVRATAETSNRFFNGTDLTGWRASRANEGKLWSVENGELIGRSSGLKENAFLLSELSLSDFHFKCEVKLADNSGNSGIQFRSQPLEDGEVRGFQADIGPGWWGKLYEEQGRGLRVDHDVEKLIRPGEWNSYEIIAVGPRTQLILNGKPIVDLVDPVAARSGIIALQLHSGGPMEVRFRNLQVQVLDPLPPYAAAGSQTNAWPVSSSSSQGGEIRWKKTTLDGVFRSEGCCFGDFDNDGDLDIATGSVWYENPNARTGETWKQHLIGEEASEFNPVGYGDTFMNYAEDLNGDGWLDLIVVGFPGEKTHWFENPQSPASADKPWPKHVMIPVTNNESPQYLDLDLDEKRELLSAVEGKVMARSVPSTFPQALWKIMPVSEHGVSGTDRFSHGLGAGDINGDGLPDVVATHGWWEQPKTKIDQPWKFHEAALGQPCSQMYVHDFDGDGDADVLSASAHRFGIWWHEQQPPADPAAGGESTWSSHLIDESISQTHAVVMADMNGDGLPDFVTGRRHWAHNGKDPGEDQPPVVVWFEFQKTSEGPRWQRHVIDEESGIGTQFEVADVNGDGLLDIVTSNKRGTFLFEQVRSDSEPQPASAQ